MKKFDQDRAIATVLGLALGDAYGRPLEFFYQEMLFEVPTYPLTRMILCGQMIHICPYI